MAERKKTTAPKGSAAKEAKPAKGTSAKSADSGKKAGTKTSKGNSGKPATAKPATKAATRPRAKKGNGVNEEMRQHMIREAAYYRALNRGFGGAADLEDWLVAEREIDTMLGRLTG